MQHTQSEFGVRFGIWYILNGLNKYDQIHFWHLVFGIVAMIETLNPHSDRHTLHTSSNQFAVEHLVYFQHI